MNIYKFCTVAIVILLEISRVNSSLAIINLLRESVAGKPEFHKQQRWEFDPEVASRRRIEFEKLHGYRSMDLIERIGLGEDGMQEERKIQQAIRDIGVPITGRR